MRPYIIAAKTQARAQEIRDALGMPWSTLLLSCYHQHTGRGLVTQTLLIDGDLSQDRIDDLLPMPYPGGRAFIIKEVAS